MTDNPFAAPIHDQQVSEVLRNQGTQLASRWARLCAAIVDSLALMLFFGPIAYYLGYFDFETNPAGSLADQILLTMISVSIWALLNVRLLQRRSQTIGKYLLGIRIENRQGGRADFSTILFKRILPFWILTYVPLGHLLNLIDALLIFRGTRACLHDELAGTEVIVVPNIRSADAKDDENSTGLEDEPDEARFGGL